MANFFDKPLCLCITKQGETQTVFGTIFSVLHSALPKKQIRLFENGIISI